MLKKTFTIPDENGISYHKQGKNDFLKKGLMSLLVMSSMVFTPMTPVQAKAHYVYVVTSKQSENVQMGGSSLSHYSYNQKGLITRVKRGHVPAGESEMDPLSAETESYTHKGRRITKVTGDYGSYIYKYTKGKLTRITKNGNTYLSRTYKKGRLVSEVIDGERYNYTYKKGKIVSAKQYTNGDFDGTITYDQNGYIKKVKTKYYTNNYKYKKSKGRITYVRAGDSVSTYTYKRIKVTGSTSACKKQQKKLIPSVYWNEIV